ncbi:hypothetical protein LPU83_pLPU83d_0310 (plasmid) [Rhizobium favelukesii]|uniref:Uncharacterized protein n=1 Tax=Rhizobium favelukesii TaxID=348824 RepID=W6S5Z3_9HYPH|nr:hypothetical protein LPU83_pLPU83d_0310 [Rhizobium favelukesii]
MSKVIGAIRRMHGLTITARRFSRRRGFIAIHSVMRRFESLLDPDTMSDRERSY